MGVVAVGSWKEPKDRPSRRPREISEAPP